MDSARLLRARRSPGAVARRVHAARLGLPTLQPRAEQPEGCSPAV